VRSSALARFGRRPSLSASSFASASTPGEFERLRDKLSGIAVATAARTCAAASPGEVLVTGTVKDLVAGSGIGFLDRDVHALKGVPGSWQLFAVAPRPAAAGL
jgi:class 3 adenylate cyclase